MKALSVNSYYATLITEGQKTVECRSWKTNYRGVLLICANAEKADFCLSGRMACLVELTDIEPFTDQHLKAACMDAVPDDGRQYYAWKLKFVDFVLPVMFKGKLNIINVDDDIIHNCAEYLDNERIAAAFKVSEKKPKSITSFINNFYTSIVLPAYHHYNKGNEGNKYKFNSEFAAKFFELSGVEPSDIWSETPDYYKL